METKNRAAVQLALLKVVAVCFYSPSFLPESLQVDDKSYKLIYEELYDDWVAAIPQIRIVAVDPATSKEVAAVIIHPEVEDQE